MSSSTEIRVPRETVNDDTVTIVTWHKDAGTRVKADDLVVSIETSKAVLEVEAEAEGFLEIVAPVGAEVEIGALIGFVHAKAPAPAATGAGANGSASAQVPGASGDAVSISRKARALIDELGIDPAVFAGRGLVREADVRAYIDAPAQQEPAAPETAPEQPATAPVSSTPQPYKAKGGLMGDARSAASDRGHGIVWLAWNYFWRNWLLGNLVKVAPRGINLFLHRLRGVKMGRDCFIDPTAIVETAYPENITMGDDVRVTAGCLIMTHIKAPNYLRDTGIMPAVVKPVVLEDHSFIGVNSVIMPGVTVGRASVVASGSVVVTNVPPFTMVGGNPAKVIKKFPRPDAEG